MREECERVKSVFVCVEVCRVGRGRHERMKSVQWSLEHQKNNNNNDKKAKKNVEHQLSLIWCLDREKKTAWGAGRRGGGGSGSLCLRTPEKKGKKAERKTACGAGQEGKLERESLVEGSQLSNSRLGGNPQLHNLQ